MKAQHVGTVVGAALGGSAVLGGLEVASRKVSEPSTAFDRQRASALGMAAGGAAAAALGAGAMFAAGRIGAGPVRNALGSAGFAAVTVGALGLSTPMLAVISPRSGS